MTAQRLPEPKDTPPWSAVVSNEDGVPIAVFAYADQADTWRRSTYARTSGAPFRVQPCNVTVHLLRESACPACHGKGRILVPPTETP